MDLVRTTLNNVVADSAKMACFNGGGRKATEEVLEATLADVVFIAEHKTRQNSMMTGYWRELDLGTEWGRPNLELEKVKALVKTKLSGVQDNATLVIYLARVVRKRLIILITEK